MAILSPKQRATYLDFVAKNAGDDIVIAAALRTMYNIQESSELDKFISGYKPDLRAGDYVGMKHVHTGLGVVSSEPEHDPTLPPPAPLSNPEDLGPVPKKLGTNGQAILNMMKKEPTEWTVDGLKARLKLPVAKVKPMVALLLERGHIKRISNYTYQVV